MATKPRRNGNGETPDKIKVKTKGQEVSAYIHRSHIANIIARVLRQRVVVALLLFFVAGATYENIDPEDWIRYLALIPFLAAMYVSLFGVPVRGAESEGDGGSDGEIPG